MSDDRQHLQPTCATIQNSLVSLLLNFFLSVCFYNVLYRDSDDAQRTLALCDSYVSVFRSGERQALSFVDTQYVSFLIKAPSSDGLFFYKEGIDKLFF